MHDSLGARLFPPDVACFEFSPLPANLPIDAGEAEFIFGAGPKRRREFAAGRSLARKALAELGLPESPIEVGPDRAPVWPQGIVGSISHTDDYCVAVLAKCPPYRSLGIDAEPAQALEPALWPQICTPTELEWLGHQPHAQRGILCHLLFTVKECVYKYQAPISHTFLEFQDVEASVDSDATAFRAVITRAVPGFSDDTPLSGRYLISRGLILAALH